MNQNWSFRVRGLRLRAYQGDILIYQRRLTGPEADIVKRKLGARLERDLDNRA